MNVFWASRLVLHTALPDTWLPLAMQVLDALGQPYQASWTTTDADRLRPWAVGAAILTDAQVQALKAEAGVHVFSDPDWTRTFGSLPGGVRNRINSFCDEIGVPRPQANEVLRDLFNRLVQVIESAKSIEGILSEAGSR